MRGFESTQWIYGGGGVRYWGIVREAQFVMSVKKCFVCCRWGWLCASSGSLHFFRTHYTCTHVVDLSLESWPSLTSSTSWIRFLWDTAWKREAGNNVKSQVSYSLLLYILGHCTYKLCVQALNSYALTVTQPAVFMRSTRGGPLIACRLYTMTWMWPISSLWTCYYIAHHT